MRIVSGTVVVGLLAALLLALPVAASASPPQAAVKLARDAIIVDTHVDAPGVLMDKWADLDTAHDDREFDYVKARAGGLDVAFMSIYTSHGQDEDGTATQTAHRMIDAVEALVQRHPDKFAILTSPKDVDSLREGGRVLLPLGMENGAPLGNDIGNVQVFFDRGIRYITLAHSGNNRLSDSSYTLEKKWNGLSPLGREVVGEMNRLGIMVDVSHLGDAAVAEAVALSKAPVIASHSGFRALTPDFERNISDELAKAVADKGGVIQVPFGTAFIDPQSAANLRDKFLARADLARRNAALKAQGKPEESREAFEKAWDAEHPVRQSTLAQVLDQIDHGVKALGVDHVGIGSDFDGVGGELPGELKTVADFPNLVAGLQARGYSEADIRKILGGNLLRVWSQVEAGAKR